MPERNWKKVKELFNEALRHDSSERERFLDVECADDIELRIEVESLLLSLNEAKSFLEMPVVGETPKVKGSWQLETGRRISHYRVVEPIGSGGMGEVYLADDERLGRQVALKILPQDMLRDTSRLRRFEREAHAVSALNHPNILTIFDFEQEDGIHLFASEYVKGETLRRRLDSSRLSVIETLEIAIQIASALSAAHEAGVVHRDIKPENLMIREDGYVKVLDFGLAKLTERVKAAEVDRTQTQHFSRPGMIMGTVTYMSPEQARGIYIDGRSDIFNLGIVMYEMLSGRPPFNGETTTDVLAELIQTDPPPLTQCNEDVPAELDEIVKKALSKNPIDRFQKAEDILAQLKDLLKRLEFAELERATMSEVSSEVEATEPTRRIPENGTNAPQSYLPGDLSPMVGRDAEIAELSDLVINRGVRLVTLTGAGGTGKTRLAREICRRWEDKFREGFVFVRLAEVCDASMVADAIAREVGVQEVVGTPIAESLKELLQDRQMLLVIDNFEHVMDAAQFVADLLASAKQLSVLVTSRERLHLQAEIEFNVPPLATPEEDAPETLEEVARFDSVRLFVERAQRANPDFELTEETAGKVARICSMLDGLPLAIELAAARTRNFSPATILEKLESQLTFLTGGARDLPERQRTMRAAAEWSYDLLNESEKLVFRRLSVFAGQFTPDAAETVASVNTSIVSHQSAAGGGAAAPQSVEFFDRFASLADKSLLIRRRHAGDETNFGMLRIVREYAQSVLETDDDANEIRLRHAKLYLSLAEEAEPHLRAHDSCLWMSRLNEEHENLRAALHWSIKEEPQIAARLAAAIRHFWLTRGYLREGMGWAQEILDKECDMTPETRWKLLTICGNISQFQGDIQKAHKFYEEGLAAARRSGDQKYIAQSLRGLGALAYIKYDLPTARKLIDEALAISRSEGDNFGLAASLGRLGDISNVQGDRCTAKDLTSEALAIFRRLGYAEGVSAKLYNLGAIVFLEGDHEMAQSCFEEAHLTSLELREKINTRLIFDGFAAIAAEKGDYSLAARLSGAAQSIDTTIGYAIEPAEQIFRDSYLGKLRAAMTEEEFEAESAIGRKLTMEQMRKLVQPGPRVESNIKGSNSGSGVPLHTTSSVSTPMNDIESLSGVFARAARYQNVVLAVLLSILLVTAAFIFALWIWGAK